MSASIRTVGDKVYHVCSPAPTAAADPCLTSSAPVRVLASISWQSSGDHLHHREDQQRRHRDDGRSHDEWRSIDPGSRAIRTDNLGSFSLTAYAAGSNNGTSKTVQAVNDLEACWINPTFCDNLAANQASAKQTSFGKIVKTVDQFVATTR